jgi:hypothetical protein
MTSISKTAIVYNSCSKKQNLPEYYYRWRKCDTDLTNNTPASQYQRLKLIQNTVRVQASLYVSNLGSLSAYQKPTSYTHGVCWNQMSDRPVPSVQRAVIPTGSNSTLNRRHTSVTSSRPGCQAPGGIGCDIKHNSYDRYLNRLKGKGPLRRGAVPPTFGAPIPFNPAFPIYGAKTTKTNIVAGCDCPIEDPAEDLKQDIRIYDDPYWKPDPVTNYEFGVGDNVYAIENGTGYYSKAIVISVNDGIYVVQFEDGRQQTVTNANELLVYYNCNCTGQSNGYTYNLGIVTQTTNLEE